jgi:hypothetical protein
MKECKNCGQMTDRYYSKRHKKCVECFNKVSKRKILDEFKPIVRKGRYETIKFIFTEQKNEMAINSLLGCNHRKVRQHLESKFQKGMNWNNHGAWHVDHIRPFSSARTMRELKMLFRWQNIQPLWAEANLRKGRDMIGDSKLEAINKKMADRYDDHMEKLSSDIIKTKTIDQMRETLRDFRVVSIGDLEACAQSIGYEREGDLFIKRRKI